MKIRTAHVVAMTVVLLALAIAACGGVAGPAAGQGPGSINAATVKACDDILAFEHGDADGTFNQEPASVKALHDARHTPLENDLAAWIKAMNAAGRHDRLTRGRRGHGPRRDVLGSRDLCAERMGGRGTIRRHPRGRAVAQGGMRLESDHTQEKDNACLTALSRLSMRTSACG